MRHPEPCRTGVRDCGFTPTVKYTTILNSPTFHAWVSAMMFTTEQLTGFVLSSPDDDQTVEMVPIGVNP